MKRRNPVACGMGLRSTERMLLALTALVLAAPFSQGTIQAPPTDPTAPVTAAIRAGTVRGAVLLVGRGDDVLHASAHGERAPGVSMTIDTVFDLASLTKPIATAASAVALAQAGKLGLDDPVVRHLPEFAAGGGDHDKSAVTVEHLLLHTSGLAPANAMSDFADGAQAGLAKILGSRLRSAPGDVFAYSDLGFITLGRVVEVVSGEPLEVFSRRAIHAPLGMVDTSYGPLSGDRLARCAPTEAGLTGTVHDPRAAALGGVAGHAGLFATGGDVARFCAMLATGRGPLGQPTLEDMTRPRLVEGGDVARGLGLDIASKYSSPRGAAFPRFRSFGHTGFTGPCFWVDGDTGLWYVLMLSRLQVEPAPSVSRLRRAVADAVVAWSEGDVRSPVTRVLTGIDRLAASDCAELRGRRVGLITNVTGRTSAGERTIDVLHRSKNVELVRLFSPEHGLYAKIEGSVGDAVDEPTGLPVFSLYGDTRKPTPEMLDGLDAVVFDVQDIGVRYYTYPSTLGLAMEACADAGVTMIVLDRPNPITGERVAGPRIDADRLSFIGWRPLPVTHGMTIGELAQLFRAEWGGIACELEVVPMEGWRRGMWWEQTGVPWIDPSPNMRNPTQAVLYPCVGLLEGTNLSVGRGTDEPFERFGAPWIDGPRLAGALRGAALPGLEFTAIEFTPDTSKFEGEVCHGVHITVTDRAALRPVEAGLAIFWTLNDLFGDGLDASRGDSRLISAPTWRALLAASDWRDVPGTWADDVASFIWQRAPYLLYE